jgi:hypothetical protein
MAILLEKGLRFYPGFCWGTAALFLCLLIVCAPLRDAAAANESVATKKGGAAQDSSAKSNDNTTAKKDDTRQEPTVISIEHELFDPEESLPEESLIEDENEASSQKSDSGPASEIDKQFKGSGLTFDPSSGRAMPEGIYNNTGPR